MESQIVLIIVALFTVCLGGLMHVWLPIEEIGVFSLLVLHTGWADRLFAEANNTSLNITPIFTSFAHLKIGDILVHQLFLQNFK